MSGPESDDPRAPVPKEIVNSEGNKEEKKIEEAPAPETAEELEMRKKLQFKQRCCDLIFAIQNQCPSTVSEAASTTIASDKIVHANLPADLTEGEVEYAVANATEGGESGGPDGEGEYEVGKAIELLGRVNWGVVLVVAFTSKQLEMLEFSLERLGKRVVFVPGRDLRDYYIEQTTKESQVYDYNASCGTSTTTTATAQSGLDLTGVGEQRLGNPTNIERSTILSKAVRGAASGGEEDGGPVSHQYDIPLFIQMWEGVIKPALGCGRFLSNVEVAVTSGEAFIPLVDWLNTEVISNAAERAAPLSLSSSPCSSAKRARPWNCLATSPSRRDKFLMQQRMEEVSAASSSLSHSKEGGGTIDRGVHWAKSDIVRNQVEVERVLLRLGDTITANSPLVIKPTLGAGSEHLEVCFSAKEVRATCERLLGQVTKQFTSVQALCLQEYLKGDEFVVDVVSLRNKHVVTDVWLSEKNIVQPFTHHVPYVSDQEKGKDYLPHTEEEDRRAGRYEPEVDFRLLGVRTILYRQQVLLPHCRLQPSGDDQGGEESASLLSPLQEKAAVAVKYAVQVIESLDLTHGPSHVEIIVQADNTAKLVELNPRLQGDTPRSGETVGFDQISLLAYLLSAPEAKPWVKKKAIDPSQARAKSTTSSESEREPPARGDEEISRTAAAAAAVGVGVEEEELSLRWPPRPFDLHSKAGQTTTVPSLIYEEDSWISWYDTTKHGCAAEQPPVAPLLANSLIEPATVPLQTFNGVIVSEGYATAHQTFIPKMNTASSCTEGLITPVLPQASRRVQSPPQRTSPKDTHDVTEATEPITPPTSTTPAEPQQPRIVWVHYLCSFHLETGLINDNGRCMIKKLPTFARYTRCALDVPPGRGSLYRVKRTVDLLAAPGAVVLEGRRDAVRRDVNFIRDMERCYYNPHYYDELHQNREWEREARMVVEWEREMAQLDPNRNENDDTQLQSALTGTEEEDNCCLLPEPDRVRFYPHILPDPEHDEIASLHLARQWGVVPLFADNTTIMQLKGGNHPNARYWGIDNLLQKESHRLAEKEAYDKMIERQNVVLLQKKEETK